MFSAAVLHDRLRKRQANSPPTSRPAEKLWYIPIDLRTWKVCTASSRVGDRTTAPGPSAGGYRRRYSFSRSGTRKASVLPLRRGSKREWGNGR